MDLERSRIAHGLRRLREQKNYSQEYVADRLGKKEATAYSRIEQGRTELKFDDAFKLASLYKVSMERIYDPELKESNVETWADSRAKYETVHKLNLQVTLDGSPETLQRQVELLQSVNQVLAAHG
jgi:transcriptional regulator with XRE-family HTH domain